MKCFLKISLLTIFSSLFISKLVFSIIIPFFGPFFSPFEGNKVDIVAGLEKEPGEQFPQYEYEIINNQTLFPTNFTIALENQYSIVKWSRVQKNSIQGNFEEASEFLSNLITQTPEAKQKELLKGKLPPEPNLQNPFRFLVFGDTREGEGKILEKKTYLREGSVFVETVNFIKKCFPIKQQLQDQPILYLHTGDLVRAGGKANQWIEVLKTLDPIIKNRYFIAAIGNHEIYSEEGGVQLHYQWSADKIIPYFNNLFYYKDKKSELTELTKQVENTQRWFDIGCVRFIHLPLIHERVTTEKGTLRERIGEYLYPPLPSEIFSPRLIGEFIANLDKADTARKNNEIQFIIVYGHMPLVTSTSHNTPHPGLFELSRKDTETNSSLLKAIKRMEPAFKDYKPDAYFCGHNHLYDRVIWNGIPMVTVGIGTNLISCEKKNPRNTFPSEEFITPNYKRVATKKVTQGKFITKKTGIDRLIGFLDCHVIPQENKIICRLAAKESQNGLEISPPGNSTGDGYNIPQSTPEGIHYYDYFEIKKVHATETQTVQARKRQQHVVAKSDHQLKRKKLANLTQRSTAREIIKR